MITLNEITDVIEIKDIYSCCVDQELDLLHRNFKKLDELNRAYVIDTKGFGSVGVVGLYNIDLENKTASVDGFVISNEYKSSLKEALLYIIKEAFEEFSLYKLNAMYIEDNSYMEEVWNCLRFVHEGAMRDQTFVNNKHYHVAIKGLIRHEYERYFLNEEHMESAIYNS